MPVFPSPLLSGPVVEGRPALFVTCTVTDTGFRSPALASSLSSFVWVAENRPVLMKTQKEICKHACHYRTGQDRTGQDRTGQDRTGQENHDMCCITECHLFVPANKTGVSSNILQERKQISSECTFSALAGRTISVIYFHEIPSPARCRPHPRSESPDYGNQILHTCYFHFIKIL